MRNSKSFRAEDRIIQFFIRLNEEFHGVVSQVLLMDPLPQINKVLSMVMQQERKISGTLFTSNIVVEEGESMINVVDGTKQSFGRGRGNGHSYAGRGRGNLKVCTYCGKTGHIIDNCYKKHGYPPSFGRGNSYANQVEVDESEKCVATSTSDSASGNMSLTREQYHNLMMILEKNTSSINLTKGVFEVNLISLSKLCREQDCNLVFETNKCIIQAKKGLKKIGLAKEIDGLYYLEDVALKDNSNIGFVSSVFLNKQTDNVVAPPILWNLRLGHLSYDRMKCMSKTYSYIPSSVHKACDVCQQGRQKCLPFSTSNNNAHQVFVLFI
ncbi:uncharacterized protein LOC131619522 [Vicia villosa]|uniref:uncharacterized protein LOC131619522 n=1 Tax=Vicia villosa TaxID=3911 RepID=UPI00273B6946|nr:uncharacterized protein LOC131619522 [Vicia villosa]